MSWVVTPLTKLKYIIDFHKRAAVEMRELGGPGCHLTTTLTLRFRHTVPSPTAFEFSALRQKHKKFPFFSTCLSYCT